MQMMKFFRRVSVGASENPAGILYIVATPIGNLEDITLRALRILKEADLIAAEDTRRTRQLLTHYGIHKPLVSYHEHNRRLREKSLLADLRQGKKVALVTDAGTPGISDPGEDLVRTAIQESIPLIPIPGPSALISALSISGLATQCFLFYGFLPARTSARQKFLGSLKERKETLIFYESPRRLQAFLEDARTILGDRRGVVAREITKVFEEVRRGTLSELVDRFGKEEVRGEVTILLEGRPAPAQETSPAVADALAGHRREGFSWKESVARVAAELGLSRREVYQESLHLRSQMNPARGDGGIPGKDAGDSPDAGKKSPRQR
jgi:16S rRNA (cytidine1402-2'-O)-methyltransferase